MSFTIYNVGIFLVPCGLNFLSWQFHFSPSFLCLCICSVWKRHSFFFWLFYNLAGFQLISGINMKPFSLTHNLNMLSRIFYFQCFHFSTSWVSECVTSVKWILIEALVSYILLKNILRLFSCSYSIILFRWIIFLKLHFEVVCGSHLLDFKVRVHFLWFTYDISYSPLVFGSCSRVGAASLHREQGARDKGVTPELWCCVPRELSSSSSSSSQLESHLYWHWISCHICRADRMFLPSNSSQRKCGAVIKVSRVEAFWRVLNTG